MTTWVPGSISGASRSKQWRVPYQLLQPSMNTRL
jgi:hypothetical protein